MNSNFRYISKNFPPVIVRFCHLYRMRWSIIFLFISLSSLQLLAQTPSTISSFYMKDSIRVTIDKPVDWKKGMETVLCFYLLPNGNTTEQTMGKKLEEGDDWHFDIQHIRAQTTFIRQEMEKANFIVVYLENDYKSWPSWKQRHPQFRQRIPEIIDSLNGLFPARKKISLPEWS